MRRAAPVLALALAFVACGRAPEASPKGTLDTVDVTEKPDATASLQADAVGRPAGRSAAVAGALPADFPRDVPLPQPSSLVDFGPRSVTFEVEGPPEAALAAYAGRLRGAGFRAEAGGKWRHGGRLLAVAAKSAPGGAAHLVVEILSGG